MECKCKRCGREYLWENYHKGYTRDYCNSCLVNRRKTEVKQKIVAYLGGKCAHCGYKKSIKALECHHVDPTTKAFPLSGSHSRSWKSIEKELKKCILLCSNCHREEEYGIVAPCVDSING